MKSPPQDFCEDERRQGVCKWLAHLAGVLRPPSGSGLGGRVHVARRKTRSKGRRWDSLPALTSLLRVALSSGKKLRSRRTGKSESGAGHVLASRADPSLLACTEGLAERGGLRVRPPRRPGAWKPGMSARRGERIWALRRGALGDAARKVKAPVVFGLLMPFSL